MMKACRIVVAVMLAGAFHAARSEPAAAAAPPPAPQDCWVEHTQIQPSSARQDAPEAPATASAYLAQKDPHPGAEHAATQRKPCALKAPRPDTEAGGQLPRALPQ